jgi:hypothetical protein
MKKKIMSIALGVFIVSSGFTQNLVVNGGFELSNDGNKHLFITERSGWMSDDMESNHNGAEYSSNMFGNYYWFTINTAGTIYQPIDIITSDSALYNVSYYYGTVWNADAGNDTIYSVVYFSHYKPGSSMKSRVLIDSIATDITSAGWNSLVTASFKLPANTSYAGDSLIVEFATRVVDHHAINNNTWAAADSIVVTKSVVKELVKNSGFELPDDGSKHLFITERSGWMSDDMESNHNGAELSPNMSGNYYWFTINTAGTIYQPIDKITNDSVLYNVSYNYGTVWNADAGNDTIYSVVYFSHYKPGSDIKSRVLIDSMATDVTSAGWNSLVTVSYKLLANTSYAGDSLIVEFATRVVDHHAVNNNTWAAADGISVIKRTGSYIGGTTNYWTVFPISHITDGMNLPSDFSPGMKLRWDDDSIYMIFDVNDTLITTNVNSDIWNNDNIEVYFDLTNGKVAQWPRTSGWPPSYNNNGARIPGNGYFQFRLVPDSSWATYNSGAATTANLKYAKSQGGYQFTLTIPWDTLYAGFKPTVGKEIGFDVNISDNNVVPDYRSQVTWNSPTTNIYADAALWGTLQFQPSGMFTQVMDNTSPTAPQNLKATENNSKVTLTWDASTDNIVVQQYIIKYGTIADTITALKTDNNYKTGILDDGEYKFSVTAIDLYGNKSSKAAVSVTIGGVDVKSINSTTVAIYPNPASSYITLKNIEPGIVVKFFSVTGQNVLTTTVQGSIIDISSLKNGEYLLKIEDGKQKYITKLIKNQ